MLGLSLRNQGVTQIALTAAHVSHSTMTRAEMMSAASTLHVTAHVDLDCVT